MKLSDIKGERTLEVIADIIDPIANIAGSEAAKKLFKKQAVPHGENPNEYAIKRIRKSVPELLKTNKADILRILAAISGKPYEQYVEEVNILTLAKDLLELLGDKAFMELFMQAQTEN